MDPIVTTMDPTFMMPAPSSSSTTESATSSASPNHGSHMLSPATSLPFTFLITFVAIFLFFVGCGCGSRRFAWELRRGAAVQRPNTARRVRQPRPILWDVWAQIGDDARTDRRDEKQSEIVLEERWSAVKPLSVTYVREDQAPQSGSSNPDCAPPLAPPVPRMLPPLSFSAAVQRVLERVPFLPPFVPPPIHEPRPESELPEVRKAPQPVRALQVSMLIVMPTPARASRRIRRTAVDSMGEMESIDEELRESADEHELGEYVLGLTEAPWTDDGS